MKITLAKDISPPWAIFAENAQHPTRPRKCLVVMPAGRPGDVADVERVPDGVVMEVVRSVNQRTMTPEIALGIFEYHSVRNEAAGMVAAFGYDPDPFWREVTEKTTPVLEVVLAILEAPDPPGEENGRNAQLARAGVKAIRVELDKRKETP